MFSVRHPLKARIEDQASFLEVMLERFPFLLDEWKGKQLDLFRKLAKEISNDDIGIEMEQYNQMANSLDNVEFERNIFYQAMMVMVCSYYESILIRIFKEEALKKISPIKIIETLCKVKDIELSDECWKKVRFLDNYIRPLRNQLCHNNNGTPKNEDVLKEIAKTYRGVIFEEGEIRISERNIVEDVLNTAHEILSELSEKLSYKTQKTMERN